MESTFGNLLSTLKNYFPEEKRTALWTSSLVREKPKRKRLMIVDRWQTPRNGGLHFLSPDPLDFPPCMLYPVFLRQEYVCGFLWILAFRNICIIIYLLLLIFYLAVWTPKTTFQTVENHLPYRASISGWFCFFTFHSTYFTLQRWTGKC